MKSSIFFLLFVYISVFNFSAQAQTMSSVPSAYTPTAGEIRNFCNNYLHAKKKYKKLYANKYQQYCNQQKNTPAKNKLSSTPHHTLKKTSSKISRITLPKCLVKGSRVRVIGKQLNSANVSCNFKPNLAMYLIAQNSTSKVFALRSNPSPENSYYLRCTIGTQSISKGPVSVCKQQSPPIRSLSIRPATSTIRADLVPTLSLLPPIQKAGGRQQNIKVGYRNRGKGSSTGKFALNITLSTKPLLSRAKRHYSATASPSKRALITQHRYGISVPASGATGSFLTALRLPEKLDSGTYYWCVQLDSRAQIIESNEGNNTICQHQKISSSTQRTVPIIDKKKLDLIHMAKLRNSSSSLTKADGKSLLPPQIDPRTLHVLADEPTVLVHGIGVPVTDEIKPDLTLRDILMNADRSSIFVDWISTDYRPLPAGRFTWQVDFFETQIERLAPAGYHHGPESAAPVGEILSDDTTPVHNDLTGSRSSNSARVNGTVTVNNGVIGGRFVVALPERIMTNVFKAEATVNIDTGGALYPESSIANNSLSKHLYRSRALPALHPSEILSVDSFPAHGAEHISISYSLSGSRPGRLGIFMNEHTNISMIPGASIPDILPCFPNAGDGYTLARTGWNQTLDFVCPMPIAPDIATSEKNVTAKIILLNAEGDEIDRLLQLLTLHHPISQATINDSRKTDLTVHIVNATRYNGRSPRIILDVANQGAISSPATEVLINVWPKEDGICHWPFHFRQRVPELAAGQHQQIIVSTGTCRRWAEGTLRIGPDTNSPRISVLVDPDNRIPELNETNNSVSRTIGDALNTIDRDIATRIDTLTIQTTPMSVDCRELGSIEIAGGPFQAGITMTFEAGSDRANRYFAETLFAGRSLRPRIEQLSEQQLRIAITKCVLNSDERIKMRLNYPSGGQSRWYPISRRH